MQLTKKDKRMFEYICHLHHENKDYKNLTWQMHQQLPSSDWQFPNELEEYYQHCFADNLDLIQNKKVIDIGCEYGNKIPWFDKFSPKHLLCIDPNSKHMYLANYVATLVDCDTSCITGKAEDCDLKADTVFMLSVNQHFDNQLDLLDKLDCEHIVIDTWTDNRYKDNLSINTLLEFFDNKYINEKIWFFKSNRIVLRYRNK